MKRSDIEERTTALVLPILKNEGCELWDVEYVKEGSDMYLRVYADKDGGITIDNCANINRALSDKLDEDDFIDGAYILEVSSPGLTRKLKRDRDFEKSIGRLVYAKLYKAVDGIKEFTGHLKSFTASTVTLRLNDGEAELDRDNISSIRLEYEEQDIS